MKLAMLGSTGFVGTVLLPKALAQGHQIKVLVRPLLIGSGKATGNVAASEADMPGMKIDVEDIADFILSLLKTKEWERKAPIISSKGIARIIAY